MLCDGAGGHWRPVATGRGHLDGLWFQKPWRRYGKFLPYSLGDAALLAPRGWTSGSRIETVPFSCFKSASLCNSLRKRPSCPPSSCSGSHLSPGSRAPTFSEAPVPRAALALWLQRVLSQLREPPRCSTICAPERPCPPSQLIHSRLYPSFQMKGP